MPVQVGKAGTGARKLARKRMKNLTIAVLTLWVISIVSYLIFLTTYRLQPYIFKLIAAASVGLSIGLIIVLYKYLFSPKEFEEPIDRALRGAAAEEKVSELFNGLPPGYAIFNDIPCPMGNIDHIVLGKTGVFVIETKSHQGEITLSKDGRLLRDNYPFEKNILKQVMSQCFWLREQLTEPPHKPPFIIPILVFTDAFVKVYKPVKNVRILNKKWVVDNIVHSKASKVNRDQLDRVFYKLLGYQSVNEEQK